jgi:hypothetical protein
MHTRPRVITEEFKMQQILYAVASRVAELTIFFAAAAGLVAGALVLR